MRRKQFLQQLLPAGIGLGMAPSLLASPFSTDPPVSKPAGPNPPYLKPGDLVAITCPASPVERKDVLSSQQIIRQLGFNCCIGHTVGKQWERFGGTDIERATDLQLLLEDPSVKAVLFGRGGYGVMRMMDKVNWDALARNPKWLIGYSDITAIHCHVNSTLGIPTLHGTMAGTMNSADAPAARSLWQALQGKPIQYMAPSYGLNRKGVGTGMLVGGNLSLIAATMGSVSEIQTDGRLLLIEDVSEYKYTIDRMLMTLKRAGKLNNLAGLIVGGFTATKADSEMNYPSTVEEIILEKVQDYKYPVCFRFPAGHIANNMALKLGMHYNLYVTATGSQLSEVQDPHPTLPLPTALPDSLLKAPSGL